MHAMTRPMTARALAGMAAALLVASACSSKTTPAAGGGTTSAATSASAQAGGSSSSTSGAAMIKTTNGALGTFLTDGTGRTVYLFMADTSKTSTCSGSCATYWPPVLTSGAPTADSGVDGSKLGTTQRKDGKMQVTYGGHPLYTFLKDKKAGDATGQGSTNFNAKWWVVGVNGDAITTMSGASASSGASSSSGGGGGNY